VSRGQQLPQRIWNVEHVIVFKQPGRFGGWPANNGIWSWGDEIVTGFNEGALDLHKFPGHPIKGDENSGRRQVRSRDGGVTWELIKKPHFDIHEMPLVNCPGGITFTQKDFAMKVLATGVHAGSTTYFYVSYDRCTTWEGPYQMPFFGLKGIAGRTDYQVMGGHDAIVFLAANKSDGYEGRAFCARTRDGGKSFQFLSWIGPELAGWTIMPASVRLPNGRLLAALRCNFRPEHGCQVFSSDDEGRTWNYLSEPVKPDMGGNPPAMIRMTDGRLVLTWGHRVQPRGIRAFVSEDNGKTWTDPIILREDGGASDVGYTRTVQRADGKIVTVYYFNDPPTEEGVNTERYIAATIWHPDEF